MYLYIIMLWLTSRVRQTSLPAHIHYLNEEQFILRNKSFHVNNGDDHRFPSKVYKEDIDFSRDFALQISKYELLKELLNEDSDYAKILKIQKYHYLFESSMTSNITKGGLFDDYFRVF